MSAHAQIEAKIKSIAETVAAECDAIREINVWVSSYAICVDVAVHGYWSRESIRGRVDEAGFGYSSDNDDVKLRYEVSHSSGGTDGKLDILDAEENFGIALAATVKMMRQIKELDAEICEAFAAQRAAALAAYEEEQARQLAAIEADAANGVERATKQIDAISKNPALSINMYYRGRPAHTTITCSRGRKTVFYIGGTRTSRANAIQALAAASERSCVEPHGVV